MLKKEEQLKMLGNILIVLGIFVAQIFVFYSVESNAVRAALAIFSVYQIYKKFFYPKSGKSEENCEDIKKTTKKKTS